jgi:hypothetical protein
VTPLMPFPNEDTIADETYNLWLCASMNKNQDIFIVVEEYNKKK